MLETIEELESKLKELRKIRTKELRIKRKEILKKKLSEFVPGYYACRDDACRYFSIHHIPDIKDFKDNLKCYKNVEHVNKVFCPEWIKENIPHME